MSNGSPSVSAGTVRKLQNCACCVSTHSALYLDGCRTQPAQNVPATKSRNLLRIIHKRTGDDTDWLGFHVHLVYWQVWTNKNSTTNTKPRNQSSSPLQNPGNSNWDQAFEEYIIFVHSVVHPLGDAMALRIKIIFSFPISLTHAQEWQTLITIIQGSAVV